MAELQPRPNSALNPDPQPIRHLRKFSNYLTLKTGLTSVDSWTLIATFIRNMFLNWLVLISLLGAVMMIPGSICVHHLGAELGRTGNKVSPEGPHLAAELGRMGGFR
jgi:hypothetical protein